MLQSLIAPVLTTIQHHLHTTQGTVTWVLTAYLLSASVFTPILGRLGDAAGKQRTLVAVLVILAVGCGLAATAPNVGMLIVARVVQGAGGAIFPLSFGILRDELPPVRVPAAVGAISAVIAAGSGLGIVLAGPIVDWLGYTWLFWTPAVVVAAAAVAAHRFVPESPVRHPGRIDWLAAALLSGWLVCLLLAVSEAPEWGWGSPRTAVLFVTAVAVAAGWVARELRTDAPLIDMRMMRLPGVWTTNVVALLFGAAMFALFAFLPQFAETPTSAGYGFGAGVTEAGLLMLPMLVTMFAGGIVSGRLADRFVPKAQLATGASIAVVACALLVVGHDQRWQVALAAGIMGLAIGLAFSSMTNLIVHSVPPHQTGVANGMNANFRTIGGAIGAAAMASVVTAHAGPAEIPLESGYAAGFAMLTAIAVAAVVAALLVPSPRAEPQAATASAPATS
jgi:MFS family permease